MFDKVSIFTKIPSRPSKFWIINLPLIVLIGMACVTPHDVYSLRQTAGTPQIELYPGESETFQWGLVSDDYINPVTVHIHAEGDGIQFLSFPNSTILEPDEMKFVTVLVEMPENYTSSHHYSPSLYAVEYAKGGSVTINLSMQKQIDITVLDSQYNGGGCLVATATYGTEMSSQVQKLREIRDGKLLTTESGRFFMEWFNTIYYSFSPLISDYQRENYYFNEMVKLYITPMIMSLNIMEYTESKYEIMMYGGIILILNGVFYGMMPAVVILFTRRKIL